VPRSDRRGMAFTQNGSRLYQNGKDVVFARMPGQD